MIKQEEELLQIKNQLAETTNKLHLTNEKLMKMLSESRQEDKKNDDFEDELRKMTQLIQTYKQGIEQSRIENSELSEKLKDSLQLIEALHQQLEQMRNSSKSSTPPTSRFFG